MQPTLIKQISPTSQEKLTFLADMGREAQKNFDRMRPVFDMYTEVNRQIQKSYAPILKSISIATESALPIIQLAARTQTLANFFKPKLESETFFVLRDHPVSPRPNWPPHHFDTIDIPIEPAVKLPDKAEWEYLELRFKDRYTLSVFYKGRPMGHHDHATLGFVRKNTRERKPDKQWALLSQLSLIYELGDSFKPTIENMANHLHLTKPACQKIKQNLSQKLKSAFGIADDPFRKYDPITGYQAKFVIRPETDLREYGELHASGGRLIDNIM